MRGAGFLTGLEEALVVDVGGTTTDVGALTRGFPRQAALDVEVGGVRTNFRMPDVHAVGLGGGTVVHGSGDDLRLGPDSVGYRLLEEARVFGGDTLTATDVVVAAGAADLGDGSRVANLDPNLVERLRDLIRRTVDEAVDRVRLSREALPVIVVGGGRILVTDEITGSSGLIVPEHYETANAIGAAIAQVSGEEERVVDLTSTPREVAIAQIRERATQYAVAAGADPATVEVLDAEDVPLAYLPGNASRIRVKVVGELQVLDRGRMPRVDAD
jgi:N-methylhydantoinase A/oxoprolinase/acetone carboxylase beta subunit